MKKIFLLAFLLPFFASGQIISTIAGTGTSGYRGDGWAAISAMVNIPSGLAFDAIGNLYIADGGNNRIRKVDPSGMITTFAGNGVAGYSGDGGVATAANLSLPTGVAVDGSGNVYIADESNQRIRKVSPSGIITTYAGTGAVGNLGDGGPATAAQFYGPSAVATDATGNLYISDQNNNRVRKVNPSGYISAFAGTGVAGFTGDGGPATNAKLNSPRGLLVDGAGNVYISDNLNNCVREVNTAGIITTIAGYGTSGYSGDGGPATAATLNGPQGLAIDATGNMYIAESGNQRIRKILTTGIITTYAGNGSVGYGGDGGLATAAKLYSPDGVTIDNLNNLYFSDKSNQRIRKVTATPPLIKDSFSVYFNNDCYGIQFQVVPHSYHTGQHVKTYFDHGLIVDSPISLIGSVGMANLYKPYASSGIYTIKHVLYNGTVAVDSVTYSHQFTSCQTLTIKFFFDANGNCIKDSAEPFIFNNVTTEVDSNGLPINTISATSGFYYNAYGVPGDIYSFRLLSIPKGIMTTCPISIITDTLFATANNSKYFGFSCTSPTGVFDYSLNAVALGTGIHSQAGYIYI